MDVEKINFWVEKGFRLEKRIEEALRSEWVKLLKEEVVMSS